MEIIDLLKNPLDLKEDKLFLIQNELEKYPYFQALHLLQAKALKNGNKEDFNQSLEKAAAYCNNRKILFDYIYYEQKEENKKEVEKENISVPKEIQEVEKPQEKTIVSETPTPKKEVKQETETSSQSINKAHSFSQWLKSGRSSFSENEISETKHDKYHVNYNEDNSDSNFEKESIEEKFKIINEFLEKNPKIVPSREYKPSSSPLQTNEEMSHLMTETLAKIYVEQKKYDKAIKAYNILRLKYPEKSGFFADQINFIKELKNN